MTAELEAKVERGRQWLIEHDQDPPGRFYLWWLMRLHPDGRWPRQPQDVVDRYRTWHRGFEGWLRLYAQLDGSDARELRDGLLKAGRIPSEQQKLVEVGSS